MKLVVKYNLSKYAKKDIIILAIIFTFKNQAVRGA